MSIFDDYPYQIHTGHELELMISGQKPLSVFCVDNRASWLGTTKEFTLEMATGRQDFTPYISKGLFAQHHKRFETTAPDNDELIFLDYYAFTQISEEWRGKAYFTLLHMLHSERINWCHNMERLQGHLLGYTQEENDCHIERLKSKTT